MNTIKITKIISEGNRISIYYEVNGEWKKLFGPDDFFWAEYDCDVSKVPHSIAVIPIMGTLLTLSWIYDAEIIVDELDEDFFNSIPEFKKGYKTMYPNFNFKGSLTVNKVINNKIDGTGSACLFSGGVDAFNTLISNIKEKPVLLTVWGADIAYDNTEGWGVVNDYIEAISKDFGLERSVIHSNFRRIVNEELIDQEVPQMTGDMWWHGFQSGTGMLTLMAPYTCFKGIDKVYIASSFTKKFWGLYTCSSDPIIDNKIKYSGTQVIHDGYEMSRQDKIHNICEYAHKHNVKIPLRVCWQSSSGANCCKCEKCTRTILGIFAQKEDPRNYGLDYDWEVFKGELNTIQTKKIELSQYDGIPELLKKNYSIKELPKEMKWLYKLKIDGSTNKYIYKKRKELTFKEMLYCKSPKVVKNIYEKIKKKGNYVI